MCVGAGATNLGIIADPESRREGKGECVEEVEGLHRFKSKSPVAGYEENLNWSSQWSLIETMGFHGAGNGF